MTLQPDDLVTITRHARLAAEVGACPDRVERLASPRTAELTGLVRDVFRAAGGDFDAGQHAVRLLAADGLYPRSRVETVDLAEGHPYLRLPLQFARSLRPRLEQLVPAGDLDHLLSHSAAEIDRPGTRGVTFALVQTWAVVP